MGSSPCPIGSMMALCENASVIGSIFGQAKIIKI